MRRQLRSALALGLLLGSIGLLCANPPVVKMTVPASGASLVTADEQATGGLSPDDRKRLDQIIQQNERLLKLLEELLKEGTESVNPPAADPKGTADLTSALTTCVGCHNEKDALKKGDRFVLFRYEKQDGKPDGKDLPHLREDLSLREWKSVEREIKDGNMPKKSSGQKLTPEQRSAILAEAGARRAELEAKP